MVVPVVEDVGLAANGLAVVGVDPEHVVEGRQRLGLVGRIDLRRAPVDLGQPDPQRLVLRRRLGTLLQVDDEGLHLGGDLGRQRLGRLTALGRGRRAAGASARARLRRRGRQDHRPDGESRHQQQAEYPEPAGGEPPPGIAGRRGRNGATVERYAALGAEPGAGRGRCAALGTEAGCRGGRHARGTISEPARASKAGVHSWRRATMGSSRAARRAG